MGCPVETPNSGNGVNEWNVNANSATNSVNNNNAFNTNGVSPDLTVMKSLPLDGGDSRVKNN